MLDSYNKRLQEYEAIYLKPERQADLGTLMLGLLKMLPMRCSREFDTSRVILGIFGAIVLRNQVLRKVAKNRLYWQT